MFRSLCVALLAGLFTVLAAAESMVRIGDPGSVFDPARFDSAYPASKEWAKAGVRGGIPLRRDTPVVARVAPGEDVQAAIDRAAGKPGVVLLLRGEHRIDKRLEMRSHVILRGEDREQSILSYDIGSNAGSGLGTCLLMRKVQRSGVEDLTLQHARVKTLDHAKYHQKYENHPDWDSGDNATVEISRSEDCWVQHCRIIDNVNRPMRVWWQSKHITLRDNYVDYAVQRGGQGSSYYEIVHATYVLMYNEHIRRIRHVCLDGTIDYCVLVHCVFEVDVNWHCIEPMANSLVTHCVSKAREVGHRWPAFCHYRDPVPTSNLIHMVSPQYDDGTVYCTENPKKTSFIRPLGSPPPKHGTLYPVTGRHIPLEQIARGNLLAAIDAAAGAKRWSDVHRIAHQLLQTLPDEDSERPRLNDLCTQADTAAEAALQALDKRPNADRLRVFCREWQHAACRPEALAKAEKLGQEELDALTNKRFVRPSAWQAFITDWDGFAVADSARALFAERAAAAMSEINDSKKKDGSSWLRALIGLIEEYPDTPAAVEADRLASDRLQADLDAILAITSDKNRQAKLKAFCKRYAGLSIAAQAQKAQGQD